MMRSLFRYLVLVGSISLVITAADVDAAILPGSIFSPVGATIDAGGPGSGSINDTLNENGLFSKFTSGISDFDTYIGTMPLHTSAMSNAEWYSNMGTTGATVTYDLGSATRIDRLALWNEENVGIGSLDLLTSLNGISFTPLASGLKPFNNPPGSYPAEVFAFAETDARYVRFVITDSPQPGSDGYQAAAIGEVAFRAAPAVVPEPTSLVVFSLLTVCVLGLAAWPRRASVVPVHGLQD